TLDNVFVLGTSVVLPGEDDARRGRVIISVWDAGQRQLHIVGGLTVMGAVYALAPFRGMLLAAVNGRLLLLGWQRRAAGGRGGSARVVSGNVVLAGDPDCELVVVCSQQTQIAALSVSVSGDYVAVGDVMSSVSLYRYEECVVPAGQLRRRLVPVARDYAGVWTTAVAAVPPVQSAGRLCPEPVDAETGFLARAGAAGCARAFRGARQERFVVADAYGNLVRMARPAEAEGADRERLHVEGRWHLGDMVNVVRAGSLVMDIPDPEFPNAIRPALVFGTLHGAIGVVASVEDGRLGRILDRVQTNMAHLLPTPGLWDYALWRGYCSDQRTAQPFGFLDGDLIEQFLDLPAETQQLVFAGGSGTLVASEAVAAAEQQMKSEFWASYSRVEAEGDVAVFSQMAVSDIGLREGVELDYVVRLVESLTRLH
ncbi:hypothetical protein IWW50_006350, partial [Coemansia erecta]